MAKAPKELIEKAKALGIKSPHLKGADKLEAEISSFSKGNDPVDEPSNVEDNKPAAGQKESRAVSVGWLYHRDKEPILFRPGQVIPAGYCAENRKFWKFDSYGKWSKNDNNG